MEDVIDQAIDEIGAVLGSKQAVTDFLERDQIFISEHLEILIRQQVDQFPGREADLLTRLIELFDIALDHLFVAIMEGEECASRTVEAFDDTPHQRTLGISEYHFCSSPDRPPVRLPSLAADSEPPR